LEVGDLDNILYGRAWHFVQLEQEQLGKRGLCALDLRGEQRLAPHIGIDV
jgi:hypothetical protein